MEWEPSQGPLSVITLARGSAAIRLIWESRYLKTPWQLAEVSLSSRWRHPPENESRLNRKACSHVFRTLGSSPLGGKPDPTTIIQGMIRPPNRDPSLGMWARAEKRAQSCGFIERARETRLPELRQLFLPNRNLT